jgi:hypothetical protein
MWCSRCEGRTSRLSCEQALLGVCLAKTITGISRGFPRLEPRRGQIQPGNGFGACQAVEAISPGIAVSTPLSTAVCQSRRRRPCKAREGPPPGDCKGLQVEPDPCDLMSLQDIAPYSLPVRLDR